MYLTGKIIVTSVLPEELKRLKDIAYNMWWSWNSEAIDILAEIDRDLWDKLEGNPVRFLHEVSQKKLIACAKDREYLKRYNSLVSEFDSYMNNEYTWFNNTYPNERNKKIAYFSAEFGLHEVLPIYSGGLGILSGDHCKSASDLGIPFTAVGLFYKQGYFKQRINHEGWQETTFTDLNPSQLPLLPVIDMEGKQLEISVELPGRKLYAVVWKVDIGRIALYLLDSNVEKNSPMDRSLTARLYGGDHETRIQQEILLGIGGSRVLDILGIKPDVYHMNEGHSAFLGLELIRKFVRNSSLSFEEAKEAASSSLTFTTHTPVPAGNDVFPVHMMDRYFSGLWDVLGTSREKFLELGMKDGDTGNFNMTVLALKLSNKKNGVSELHGAVTRNIFNSLWKKVPEEEVPITHITNGVHTLTWISREFKTIYEKYLPHNWKYKLEDKSVWENIYGIPSEVIWNSHQNLKNDMIVNLRNRLKEQKIFNGESVESVKEVDNWLDSDALTIGFARRFATYKRANLVFRNFERIKNILNNAERPVQFIFAGKAHPADRPAQEIIKNIYDISKQEGFRGKVVLIENYNMALAKKMVQGVDIWLNNPRRPLEASGTSGQKVCINGIINFSILDGWWCEGYNGKNGWIVGDDVFYTNEYTQDNADSESIYDKLENQIVPLYYQKNSKGVSEKWVDIMKESIISVVPEYSTQRMVQQYTIKLYSPLMVKNSKMKSDGFRNAIAFSDWKKHIRQNWSGISLHTDRSNSELRTFESSSGGTLNLKVYVNLGGIDPSSVKVQVYYGETGKDGTIINAKIKEMQILEQESEFSWHYSAEITLTDGGEYSYTFRIIPNHADLVNPFDMGLVKWIV